MCPVIWLSPLQRSYLSLLLLSQTHAHKIISCSRAACQYPTPASVELCYTLLCAWLSIIHIEAIEHSQKEYSCNTFIHATNMRKQ